MNNKLITGIIITALVLAGTFASDTYAATKQKQNRDTRMEEHFAAQDTDNSGTLSLEEFTASEPQGRREHDADRFAEIDTNNDQQITLDELKQNRDDHRQRMRQHFSDADKDGDGKLSEEEFTSMQPPQRNGKGKNNNRSRGFRDPESRFDEWDANNDGILQLDELPAPPDRLRMDRGDCDGSGKGWAQGKGNCDGNFRGKSRGQYGGRGEGRGRGMGQGTPRFTPEERLERHDLNEDGNVTKDEFLEFHATHRAERKAEMFSRMDENGDGFIDQDEMKPPHPPRFEKGRHGRGDCQGDYGQGRQNRFFGSKSSNNSGPAGYSLIGNSPNPFNSTTTISYEIPESAQVTLKVYNVNGQEVATLVNELQGANRYDVNFNISDLTSGVYFYHLKAGDFSAINRMLYIK